MPNAEIVFDHVDKLFDRQGPDGGPQHAVRDLTFEIKRGEVVAIVGRTGCGKSTTFNLLLGLLSPSAGSVHVMGREPHVEFDWFRGKVAVVFQSDRLLPWRSAEDNVRLGLQILGRERGGREVAREWLRRLELGGAENAFPHQLSGGMRQRVSIARAFALDPDIVLCDESFTALDEITADVLRGEFLQLVRQEGKTAVFITHSITEALSMGERILVFGSPGHVVEEVTAPDHDDADAVAACRRRIMDALVRSADDAAPSAPEASR